MSEIIDSAFKLIPKERSSVIFGLLDMIEELSKENEDMKKQKTSNDIQNLREKLSAFKDFLQYQYHLPVSNRMIDEFIQKEDEK